MEKLDILLLPFMIYNIYPHSNSASLKKNIELLSQETIRINPATSCKHITVGNLLLLTIQIKY